MQNKGFELGDMKIIDLGSSGTNFKMVEKQSVVTSKVPWLARNMLLMIVGVVVFVSCMFGILYYIQQSDKRELQKELQAAISELEQLKTPKTYAPKLSTMKYEENLGKEESRIALMEPKPEVTIEKMIGATTTGSPNIVPQITTQLARTRNEPTISLKKSLMYKTKPWLNMRLPTSIIPETYNIGLDVDMKNDVYNGNVTINVVVTMDTDVIIFHSLGLQLHSVTVNEIKTGCQVDLKRQFLYEPNEFYVIETNSILTKDTKYAITIKFAGVIGNELSGFYKSYAYNGKKVASTFFSPISARKAFPCFDEPAMKANFTLTLTHDRKYNALSNMDFASVCTTESKVTTEFKATLKMSTYIVCWVISEYKYIESDDKRIRAWAMDVNDVRFGLNNGVKLLAFYEEYFKIPFPLKKLDVVPIPSFGPGAMENWGINTFRAERLLIKEKTTPMILKQKSFNLMAHEFTHQWFGNLVTMKFWNDAWLKEGFANNIGAIGGSHVDKNMGSKERVLANFMLPALEVDAYATSHPISSNLKTPSDIRGVFDLITYNKGSCLVDLLHNWLGEEDFRKGLQYYLKTYAYSNADQDDLWGALSHVSKKNVKSVMDTWTLQLGYPVVSLNRLNESFVEISQKRFTLDSPGTIPPPSPYNYIWKVPIIFKSPSTNERITYLLEGKKAIMNIPETYSILNPDHALFYRVHDITPPMNSAKKTKNMTAQDRTGWISDQFSFVAAQMADLGTTLNALSFLKSEENFYPWDVAMEQLAYIRNFVNKGVIKERFNKFVRQLTSTMVKRIGWRNATSANEGSLQVLLLREACASGNQEVISQSKMFYLEWMDFKHSNLKLKPSLHPVFLDCVISLPQEDTPYWDITKMRYKYLLEQGGSGSSELLWRLTSTNDLEKVDFMLKNSLDNSFIDSQYTPYVIIKLSENSYEARMRCWEFIKNNWAVIYKRYGTDIFMMADLLSGVLNNFFTEEQLNDVKTFFADKDAGTGSGALKRAYLKIKANIEWRKNHFDNFEKWMDSTGL